MIAERRVAPLPAVAGTPERHPLVQQYVVTDDTRLADDDSHAMVDEEALADGRAGMDLDPGHQPRQVGH